MPLRILSRPTAIRRALVSSFLADVTQQIHSLRANGVMSAHKSFTSGSEFIAFRKSAGSSCKAAFVFTISIPVQRYDEVLRVGGIRPGVKPGVSVLITAPLPKILPPDTFERHCSLIVAHKAPIAKRGSTNRAI
jgi:hypothetical protein